jgi:GDPmannose 4,6-dehydratase
VSTKRAQRRALVIGCGGQDGSYLTEFLLEAGYDVVGVLRGHQDDEVPNLSSVRSAVKLVRADLAETDKIASVLAEFQPQEIYNFAGVTFGPDAWTDPALTAELSTVALARLMTAMLGKTPDARFFQASSAWVFGQPAKAPQNERTRYAPLEPYGAAKAYGNFLIQGFREKYGFYGCSGIFYNHESPRRPERFVTRKITRTAARIKVGQADELVLGDITAERDWGYAKDYVRAAWLSLQQDSPDDFVIATGQLHTVGAFIERAFARVGLNWREHVRFDESLVRSAADVVNLVGDASAARDKLGWEATTSFEDLVDLMVDADLASLR